MGGLGSARRRSVVQGRRACGSSFLLGPGQALGLVHRAARHGPSRSIPDRAQVDRRNGRGPGHMRPGFVDRGGSGRRDVCRLLGLGDDRKARATAAQDRWSDTCNWQIGA